MQDTMLRLIRNVDQLLLRASLDAEGVRQRLQIVDAECEDFMVKLDNRRKNISSSVSFFNQAETVGVTPHLVLFPECNISGSKIK